ncbi:MAG: lipoate--protein ligase family protein [Acidobacteriota bacterium]|nr:lipoate--protein ligase family protein [Acidobacteriota bacterium]
MTIWRYLVDDGVDAARGLAVDEALTALYGRNHTNSEEATLRLYTYQPHCALVGRYQSLEDEVDLDRCAARGVQVGRRPTGGGAIIMGPAQLGVAVVRRSCPEKSPRETLRDHAGGVIAGLEALGIEARFRSKNDLEVEGRKIAGMGLYLHPDGGFLFHTSVLVDLDIELMLDVLRIPGAKLLDKPALRIGERVTTVARETGRPLLAPEVRQQFASAIATFFKVKLETIPLPDEHTERVEDLLTERYGNTGWVSQRSPQRDARGSSVLKTPEGLIRIYAGVRAESIKSVLITGDFNVLPPSIPRLEAALKWSRAQPAAVERVAAEILSPEDLGVDPGIVAGAIWQAVDRGLRLEGRAHPLRREGSCYAPEAEMSSPGSTVSDGRDATNPEGVAR